MGPHRIVDPETKWNDSYFLFTSCKNTLAFTMTAKVKQNENLFTILKWNSIFIDQMTWNQIIIGENINMCETAFVSKDHNGYKENVVSVGNYRLIETFIAENLIWCDQNLQWNHLMVDVKKELWSTL